MKQFETMTVPAIPDYLAPDQSKIRELVKGEKGSMAHCVLPPGQTTVAVTHKTVEEHWFFIKGRGQVWRKQDTHEDIVDVLADVSLTIPVGTHFQFRNTGDSPLEFVIVTIPPWPGEDESVAVPGKWERKIV